MSRMSSFRDTFLAIAGSVGGLLRNGGAVANASHVFQEQVKAEKDAFSALAATARVEHNAKIVAEEIQGEFVKLRCGESSDEYKTAIGKTLELRQQEEVFNNAMEEYFSVYDSWLVPQELDDLKTARAEFADLHFKVVMELEQFKAALPMYAYKADLLRVISENPVTIVLAETGSGKSTQMTQFLYQAGFGDAGVVACSQPRKVAAASLAKHVSKCAGTSDGILVGFSAGVAQKTLASTKILYATDHTLLRKCAGDPLFLEYSVVIVDEAHERSIFTDLLLGMLKKAVALRPDLKVIVTSATIDPDQFVQYFTGAPIFSVPGRVFPVEITWLPEEFVAIPRGPYVDQAVAIAVKIHKEEDPGDILVFLTSPSDLTQAAETIRALNVPDVVAFELHGRLLVEDQMKIFEPATDGRRKIVFATNVAETSVTIPGIVYVIDCGLAKEFSYDELRNIGRLEVCRISKSSANQRKGRAGRTAPGKCFRMFTESDYDEMRLCVPPEILRIHLGQALLTLMDVGVEDPLSFDFVAPPNEQTLKNAFQSLVHLGAINKLGNGRYELTQSGARMAKLPLEPRLARLVLRGLEEGIAFEAALTASLAAGFSVFYRFGTDEEKRASDTKKFKFCQPEGDFVTMLHVYKLWNDHPEKAGFCLSESLNNKSLWHARQTFQEVQRVVSDMTGRLILPEFRPREDEAGTRCVLVRLIAECFSENLCVFTGWEAGGYVNVQRSAHVFVHPSSSLCYLGKMTPKYLVFETVLTTESRNWALNPTPVPRAMLEDLQGTGLFTPLEMLDSYIFSVRVIHPVAPLVSWRILGPQADNLQSFVSKWRVKLNAPNLNVAVEIERGRIVITDLSGDVTDAMLDQVEDALRSTIEAERKSIMNRTVMEAMKNAAGEDCRVQFLVGAGFQLTDLLRPGDFRHIKVCVSKPEVTVEELRNVFSDHVNHIEVVFPDPNQPSNSDDSKFTVIVNSAAVAERIVLNPPKFPDLVPPAMSVLPGPRFWSADMRLHRFAVRISWVRRRNRGFGFVSFPDYGSTGTARHQLAAATWPNGNPVGVRPSRRQHELMVEGMSADMTIVDFKKWLRDNGIQFTGANFALESPKTTPLQEVDSHRDALKPLLPGVAYVDVPSPRDKAVEFRAFANFSRPEPVLEAAARLNGVPHPLHPKVSLKAEPVSNLRFTASKDVAALVEPFFEGHLEDIRTALGDRADDLEVSRWEQNINLGPEEVVLRRVVFSVKANDFSTAVEAHRLLVDLFQGYRLPLTGDGAFEILLHSEVALSTFVSGIEETTGCRSLYRKWQRSVVFFGHPGIIEDVKAEVQRYKDFAEGAGRVWSLRLAIGRGKGQGILQRLNVQFGDDLQQFVELTGATSAHVNPQRHVLTMTGTAEAFNAAKLIVDDLMRAAAEEVEHSADNAGDEETVEYCPICSAKIVIAAISNTAYAGQAVCYRLESCGHAYCLECLNYLVAQCEVPVVCVVENCNVKLSSYEYERLILPNKNPVLKERIMAAAARDLALRSAVNPDDRFVYFQCPTADCEMVLKVAATSMDGDGSLETCDLCENDVCVACRDVFHFGMACASYQMLRNMDGGI